MKVFFTFFQVLTVLTLLIQGKVSADWSQEPGVQDFNSYPVEPFWSYNDVPNILIRGDLLYWKAMEGGLDLGNEECIDAVYPSVSSDISDYTALYNKSKSEKLQFESSPGFRVGLLCPIHCFNFDIAVNWIQFLSSAKACGSGFYPQDYPATPFGVTFLSNWERFSFLYPERIKSKWNLNLNLVDLEFGKTFTLCSSFAVRPYVGSRFAYVLQQYKTESRCDSIVNSVASFHAKTKSISNYAGVGVRAGTDLQYHLWSNLSIVGSAAASLLYGSVESTSKEHASVVTTTGGSTPVLTDKNLRYHYKSCYNRTKTILDLSIGLMWSGEIACYGNCMPYGVAILYEQHSLYRMNNFVFEKVFLDELPVVQEAPGRSKDGDLTLGGVTGSLYIGF